MAAGGGCGLRRAEFIRPHPFMVCRVRINSHLVLWVCLGQQFKVSSRMPRRTFGLPPGRRLCSGYSLLWREIEQYLRPGRRRQPAWTRLIALEDDHEAEAVSRD